MTPGEIATKPATIAGAELRGWIIDADAGMDHFIDGKKLTADQLQDFRNACVQLAIEMFGRAGIRCCTACACTENQACEGGCSWVGNRDLCSGCES